MRIKNLAAFIILLLMSSENTFSQSRKVAGKPNVLIILVDDLGWRDLHTFGSDFYESPQIDRIATQSLRFTNAYANYPRCVPSRYSIMTGRHPARLRGDGEGRDGESAFTIDNPVVSIGQAMKNSGYTTFYVGKWHLGGGEKSPAGVGFDRSVAAGQAGATSSHFAPYNESRGGASGNEKAIPDLDDAPKDEYLADRLTDETIKLIKAANGKPFFGILAQYAVHTPIQGKPEYVEYFNKKLREHPVEGPEFEPETAGENKLKQDNPKYAAMIKSVDEGVGRIIKALEVSGILDNTVLIITSDHGGLSSRGNARELATTNRPLRAGKGHLYEGGIKVPLLIKWPGVINPGETHAIVQGMDLYPTLLDMVGGSIPAGHNPDGRSFMDVIKGRPVKMERTLFWHNGAPRPVSTADIYSSAIRKGEYKLIDFFGLGKKELYRISDDIGEKKNIANERPDLVKELYDELSLWRKNIGADMRLKPNNLSEAEKAITGQGNSEADTRKGEKKAQRAAGKNIKNQ